MKEDLVLPTPRNGAIGKFATTHGFGGAADGGEYCYLAGYGNDICVGLKKANVQRIQRAIKTVRI